MTVTVASTTSNLSLAGLTATGTGSGLDVASIVSQLVNNQFAAPQATLTAKLQQANTQISDAGKLKSNLSSLQSALQALSSTSTINPMQLNVSNASLFSATAATPIAGSTSSTNISPGTYQVEVKQLAQQQSLASDYVADPTHLGSGSFTIDLGSYGANNTTFTSNKSTTITIASGNDSLITVRDAINHSNSGVTASIITDGSGKRLTFTSNSTGASNAIRITTADPALSALKYDPTNTSTPDGLTETIKAQDSQVKINGLLLTQSTNQLNNAISGVNLTLTQASPGTISTLGITNNTSQTSTLITNMVNSYNSTISMIKTLTNYNKATKTPGDFSNDPQLRALQTSLTQVVTGTVSSANAHIKTIADLGIKIDSNTGSLTVNQTTLTSALTNNLSEVENLFIKSATSTDSNVQVTNVGANVSAGSYAINLTELTPGTSVAGTIGGLTAYSAGSVLSGSGILYGLSVNFSGGSTGNRGQINVSDGIGILASNLITTYIQTGGTIDKEVNQINQKIKKINTDQTNLTSRQNSVTTQYTKQFQSLDTIMTNMQNTSASLTSALKGLLR